MYIYIYIYISSLYLILYIVHRIMTKQSKANLRGWRAVNKGD